jgi:hypothetical protein
VYTAIGAAVAIPFESHFQDRPVLLDERRYPVSGAHLCRECNLRIDLRTTASIRREFMAARAGVGIKSRPEPGIAARGRIVNEYILRENVFPFLERGSLPAR